MAMAAGAAAENVVTYAPELLWMGQRFVRNAHVSVDQSGRIVSAGAQPTPTGYNVERLDHVAMVPGLVNAHSHAFQRGLRGRGEVYPRGLNRAAAGGEPGESQDEETPSFWTWRNAMYGQCVCLEVCAVGPFLASPLQRHWLQYAGLRPLLCTAAHTGGWEHGATHRSN